MISFKSAVLGAILGIVSLYDLGAAKAAPIVDIRANWTARTHPLYGWPPELALTCAGEATSTARGCRGDLSLQTEVHTTSHFSLDSEGALVVTNTSGTSFDGWLAIATSFTAFNPGGPAAGLRIDDPTTQAARFHSGVSGAGVGDWHECSIGYLGQSGTVFSPTACGVAAPDFSIGEFGLDLVLGPYESLRLPYLITIAADFVLSAPANAVPEPASGLLVLAGLGVLVFRRVSAPRKFR